MAPRYPSRASRSGSHARPEQGRPSAHGLSASHAYDWAVPGRCSCRNLDARQHHGPADALAWSDARTAGAIRVAHVGCGLRWWLVVTGAWQGTMWFDPRAEGRDLYGAAGATLGRPLTFGAWYLNWLDDVEHKVNAPS